jgi:hypothetical protein
MLIHLFIGLGLTFIGIVTICNEDKLIQFERAIGRQIKNKLFGKPEQVVVIPGESEASKQARFATGAAAGNELYGMGGDINA